jgi:molybdopterin-guanine dinucleotide biosynthesis protein
VEGFKGSPIPKIAVVRRQQDLAILEFAASELLAIAASTGVKLTSANVPVLDLDAPEPIVDFIIQYLDEWER